MDMLGKIRALLTQAENTPYEGEAAVFFSKAQDLMEKYAIDEESLWAGTHNVREKPIVEEMLIKGDGAADKFSLISTLGKHNRCIVWKDGNSPGRAYLTKIAGYPSDIAFVQMLYASLTLQMTRAMVFSMVDARGDVTRTWKLSFQEGFVGRVCTRIRENAKERETQRDTPGTDLVLAREANVDAYVKNELGLRFQNLRKTQRNLDADGYHRGRDAGSNADLDDRAKLRRQPELT